MVRLDSRQKSIRVTEGHRMLERRHKGRYIHTESQDLIGKNWDFPVSGKAEPATFPLTVTKEDDKIEARARKTSQLTEWECKFIGCWLGDGDSDILQAEGIKQGTESGSQARKGIFHLEPYLTKTPNPLWWNFSEQQFDWFLEGYWMADGNHKQGGPLPSWFEIRGARKAIFDQLQAIAVCRGYKTSLRTRDNAGTRGNNQDEWIFTLSKKEYVHVSPKFAGMEWDTDHKDETVWCIETESTNIITRRNGFVTIMGNCLTEGFNLPALEAVIMLRPTRNAALYLQAIGRGLRVDHKNPNKKFCVIIDILDTAKRKGGEAVPMPTEDDIRMYSALNGRSASAPEVFLSWFYKADELEELLDGSKRVQDLTKLNTPDLVYKQLAPPWMAHLDVNPAAEILAKIWTPDGSYKDLTSPFRSGSAEAFKLMLTRKGWVYLPHNQLPKTEEELEEYEVEALPAEVEGNYTLQTLISQDAKLKNFILDLFDPNQSLKQQAAKCYEMMPIAQSVRNIAWFNLIHKADVSFHFIQWKDGDLNVILARDSQARVYCFQQMAKRKLEHKPGFAVTYSRLPDFVKGTSWADRPMSDKQAGYVAKILHVSPEEARSMRVSKLSASALMSNHWNKTHLKNISLALATGNGLVPIVYTDDGILPISDPLNNAPGVEASPIKEAPQIKTEVTESDNDLPIDQNLSLSVDPELPF